MKKFGNTMVLGREAIKPTKMLAVSRAPLEIRWSLNQDNWGDQGHGAHLSSVVKHDAKGEWISEGGRYIGDPSRSRCRWDMQHHARLQGLVGQHVHGTGKRGTRPVQPRGPTQT